MSELDQFAPLSRVECCGTCSHWTLKRAGLRRKQIAYCPTLDISIDRVDMTAAGCDQWRQETYESQALDLAAKIEQSNA